MRKHCYFASYTFGTSSYIAPPPAAAVVIILLVGFISIMEIELDGSMFGTNNGTMNLINNVSEFVSLRGHSSFSLPKLREQTTRSQMLESMPRATGRHRPLPQTRPRQNRCRTRPCQNPRPDRTAASFADPNTYFCSTHHEDWWLEDGVDSIVQNRGHL